MIVDFFTQYHLRLIHQAGDRNSQFALNSVFHGIGVFDASTVLIRDFFRCPSIEQERKQAEFILAQFWPTPGWFDRFCQERFLQFRGNLLS